MTENSAPQTVEKALKVAANVRDRAQAGVRKARQTAGTVISATREKGEAVIDDTKEKGFRAAAETNRLFQEHPVAAVAAAAAAGAVLAIFMPRLAVAGKAAQLAKSAAKAAIATETAQMMMGSLKESRNAALRTATGATALAIGERIFSRNEPADEQQPVEDEADGEAAEDDADTNAVEDEASNVR